VARLFEFAVEMLMPWVHFRFGDYGLFRVRQVAGVEHLACVAVEAAVFFSREYDHAVSRAPAGINAA